jgi:hypothetical protein
MAKDARARRRETLNNALIQLAQQYEAAIQQSVNAIDAVARVQAQRQADLLEQQMAELEDKLARMELAHPLPCSPDDPGRSWSEVDKQLRGDLNKIDFRQVERLIRKLLDDDSDAVRASLLLLQNCSEMGGELCAARIKEHLQRTTNVSVRDHHIGFRPEGVNTRATLLRPLAEWAHINPHSVPTVELLLGQVSQALSQSMQSDEIVILHIKACDNLTKGQPDALHWIVTEFWCRLLEDLGRVAPGLAGPVTLIALLFFDQAVPDGALVPEHCCCIDDFRRDRLLDIGLRPWTPEDVRKWLTAWGGFSQYPRAQVMQLVDEIMDRSQGIPFQVANELLERCAAPQPAFLPC